jgi:outer membrane protein assembly factor BamB
MDLQCGRPNSLQPVSVGADGTIYFSVDPFVYAVNPDGSLKWVFTDPGPLASLLGRP